MNKFRIPIFLLLLVCSLNTRPQDFILRNPTNEPDLRFLDSTVTATNARISISIGPLKLTEKNTIFFNKPLLITRTNVSSFYLTGAFHRYIGIDKVQFSQRRVEFISTTLDTLLILRSKFPDTLYFKNVTVKHLYLHHNYASTIIFENCNIENFSAAGTTNSMFVFKGCELGNILFTNVSHARSVFLDQCTVKGLVNFDYSNIFYEISLTRLRTTQETKFSFVQTKLPLSLNLSGNTPLVTHIDLTKVSPSLWFNQPCSLQLDNTDIGSIQLNYAYFKLGFSPFQSPDQKEYVYQALIKNLQDNNYMKSYETLDTEYRRFHAKETALGFLWWIPDVWWKFGYAKHRIFYITTFFLVTFSIITFFSINYLLRNVYAVQHMPLYHRKYSLFRFWYAFAYTSIIFFSLSLKIDKLNFRKTAGVLYLMVVHITGIICLAYMANYIIQR